MFESLSERTLLTYSCIHAIWRGRTWMGQGCSYLVQLPVHQHFNGAQETQWAKRAHPYTTEALEVQVPVGKKEESVGRAGEHPRFTTGYLYHPSLKGSNPGTRLGLLVVRDVLASVA